jgi:hypothetical protein
MEHAHTWPWVPVSRIRRSPMSTVHLPIRAIAAAKRLSSMPILSLAGSITSTFLRRPAPDLISADDRRRKAMKSACSSSLWIRRPIRGYRVSCVLALTSTVYSSAHLDHNLKVNCGRETNAHAPLFARTSALKLPTVAGHGRCSAARLAAARAMRRIGECHACAFGDPVVALATRRLACHT